MPVGRKLLSNVATLGGFKIAGDLFVFAMFVAIARAYGSQSLGDYSFAMAATSFVAMLCNFGFEFYAVREVARDPAREAAVFGTLTLIGLALAAVAAAAVLGMAAGFDTGSSRGALTASIGLYQVVYFFSTVVIGRFKARSEMRIAGVLELGLRAVVLGGVLFGAATGASLETVIWVFPIAALGEVGVAAAVLARAGRPLAWRVDRVVLANAWPEIWPFGLALVLQTAYMKIDVLVLGALASQAELGFYAAAYRPIFGLLTIAGVASTAAYPIFSRLYVESRAELRAQIARVVNYFAAVLALAALACICAAEPLVATLYGEHFERSVPVLRVLAVDLVVSALALVFHRFLGAIDRQRAYLQSISIGVCLNSLLACLLVSRYGALGAAGSTLVSEATALALLYRHARAAECGVGLARVLARTGASIAFGLAAWQLVRAALGPEVGDWIGMLAALPVCAAALVVLGAVPRADLEAARAALRLLKVRCQPGLVRDRMREPDELRSAAPHCAREDRLRKSGVGAGSRAGRSRRAR